MSLLPVLVHDPIHRELRNLPKQEDEEQLSFCLAREQNAHRTRQMHVPPGLSIYPHWKGVC